MKNYIIWIFVSMSFGMVAQQLPLGSQYFQNMFVINPAYTGVGENVKAFASHRSQFNGLKGGPQTSMFAINSPIKAENVGLGLIVYTDRTDILSKNSAMVNYSYGLKFSETTKLHFGIALGAQNYRIDYDQAFVNDNADPILSSNRLTKTVFNADAGLLLKTRSMELGFSVPQAFTHRPNYEQADQTSLNYATKSHYRGSVLFEIPLDYRRELRFMPSSLVRFVPGAPSQFDLNAVFDHKKIGWIGAVYHSGYAFAISAGVRFKGFTFGYAYDFPLGAVSRYAQSSSEFLISYEFKPTKENNDENEELRLAIEKLKVENNKQQIQLDSLLNMEYDLNERLSEIDSKEDKNRQELDSLIAVEKELLEKIKSMKVEKTTSITPVPVPVPAPEKKVIVQETPVTKKEAPAVVTKEVEVVKKEATLPVVRNLDSYLDENGRTPEPGYYVIIGSFSFKTNAYKWKEKSISEGNKDTKILYNKSLDMREVHVFYSDNRTEAMQVREEFLELTSRAWVLELK
ncbi:MAG: PorP/SprF family type IX secretion system membrane protein [Bacteroidetes bacterium]|nr:PorP/SprF family type IX secretion system membrane protein [Bacteroidota bacterium]